MGKKSSGSSSTTTYKPTAQELRLQEVQADYAEAVAPNALWLNNVARNVLEDSLGTVQVDYDQLNSDAQSQITAAQNGVASLANGELPSAYQEAMENSISSGVTNTLGSSINSLANRGVLNSSVTNTALSDISKNVSDTMAEQYSNNISTLNGLYGQQASLAGQNISTAAAAQEAAQAPALNLWNASLGLNGSGTSALSAVSGQGTTTTSTSSSSGSSGLFSGLVGAAASVFCFAEDTKIKTPDGDKFIRHINKGQTVTSRDKDGNDIEDIVEETLEPRYAAVYVITADGKGKHKYRVSATLTQPIMLDDGTYKEVSILRIGDELKNVGKVTEIKYSGERKVYDLKLKLGGDYYANGFVAKGATDEW